MRTFKGIQWYAQRTLLGYSTLMATGELLPRLRPSKKAEKRG